ncbi:MAG: penicillin-binding protein 2 [Firmicutes bacterium]|nr:penicillin-binding protein 2 [Bacillota bacterium]MDH7494978.1 penicillin-binding protein 2 [Bacillota bacterium]
MPESAAQNRLRHLGFVVVAVLVVLVSRLWHLQIMRGDVYEALSQGNRIRLIPVPAPRGKILDRNGVPLAASRMAFSVSIVPQDVPDIEATVAQLAPILGMSAQTIKEKLAAPRRPFEPIRLLTDASPATVTAIGERRTDLPGVVIEEIPVRSYVHGDFASHLIGFIREIDSAELKVYRDKGYRPGNLIGKVGVERTFEEHLRGTDGGDQVEVNSLSQPIKVLGSLAPVPGNDVVLTIDERVQAAAERALSEQLQALSKSPKTAQAKAGAVVAIDPRTGEVLAMASKPSYDPNMFVGGLSPEELAFLSSTPSPQPNRAMSHAYPPGSAFKVITTLAALERGKVTMNDRFECTGRDRQSGKACWTIERGKAHGMQDLVTGIANSCNIVFYELGRRVGIDDLAAYARMLGLGQPTGIQLSPGDASGLVPDRAWKKLNFKGYDQIWYPTETLDVAIGQGALLATPLQIASVYATIAAGGVIHVPMVARAVLTPDGEVVSEFRPRVAGVVEVSQESLATLKQGLAKVVSEGTAASAFQGFPVAAAGKTGTAQNPEGDSHGWFAGFAPVENPEIVVVVLVEHGTSGSLAAAPVARRVMEAYFGLDRERPERQEQPGPAGSATPMDGPAETSSPEVTSHESNGSPSPEASSPPGH